MTRSQAKVRKAISSYNQFEQILDEKIARKKSLEAKKVPQKQGVPNRRGKGKQQPNEVSSDIFIRNKKSQKMPECPNISENVMKENIQVRKIFLDIFHKLTYSTESRNSW